MRNVPNTSGAGMGLPSGGMGMGLGGAGLGNLGMGLGAGGLGAGVGLGGMLSGLPDGLPRQVHAPSPPLSLPPPCPFPDLPHFPPPASRRVRKGGARKERALEAEGTNERGHSSVWA
eukprot:3903637-Rhodomonas_salina.1